MYICNRCENAAEEITIYQESRPYSDGCAYETMYDWQCRCGGYLEFAVECTVCGNVFPESKTSCGICITCRDELDNILDEIMIETEEVARWETH